MKKMLPKGSNVLVTIVGQELRVVIDISHDPWLTLAREVSNTVAGVVELYDEEDGYEQHSKHFDEITQMLANVKGLLQ